MTERCTTCGATLEEAGMLLRCFGCRAVVMCEEHIAGEREVQQGLWRPLCRACLTPADRARNHGQADLGSCCACEGPGARNLLMLPRKAPIPGRGWGCVVCDLPSDGAIAVVCDACLEADREVLFACCGYPATDGRIPMSALDAEGRHEHDDAKHPAEDLGYPADWPRCGCGKPVLDGHLTCGQLACNEAPARERQPRPAAPPMQFDGRLYWYTEWFDATDDRCCVCRGPIAEDEVPLILFKDVGTQTWQSRICKRCMPELLAHVKLS